MSKEPKKTEPSQFKVKLDQVVEAIKTVPNIWKNTEHLVETMCLVTVAGFSFWGSYQIDFSLDYSAYALRFASIVIALRGAYEFLKQMNKRGE